VASGTTTGARQQPAQQTWYGMTCNNRGEKMPVLDRVRKSKKST